MITWFIYHPFCTLGIIVFGVLAYFAFGPYIWRLNLPPGPLPWPFVGNLLLFKGSEKSMFQDVIKIGQEYGDPMTIWFGPKPQIILNTLASVREALIDNNPIEFANRPKNVFQEMDLLNLKSKDIVWGQYGEDWLAQKKFGRKMIRKIIDSERLESNVIAAADQVIDEFRSLPRGEPVDVKTYTTNIIFNVLAALCFGIRYSMTDPKFLRLLRLRKTGNETPGWQLMLLLVPGVDRSQTICKFIFKDLIATSVEQLNDIRFYIDEHRTNHGARRGSVDELRDIVDAMLLEQETPPDSTTETIENRPTNGAILTVVMDIFAAGTETSSHVLQWFVLEMAVNPEFQDRCSSQIQEVVGNNGVPSLKDRPQLFLLEAAILEVLRLHPPAPLAVPHSAVSDVGIMCGKYRVPTDVNVFYNIYAIQRSPELFEDPDSFNPERFVEPGTNRVLVPPGWIPFGVGRRVCMGENVAKNDLFLICACLLQKVRFRQIPGMEYPTEQEVNFSLTNVPVDYIRYAVDIRE